jgi:hypothetical protein
MIENDKEFQETFRNYLKSKGIEGNETCFCGRLQCDDCMLKDVSYNLYDTNEVQCSKKPFEEIKKCEKRIELLRREIDIMQNWKRNREINNKLKDFCKTLRTNSNTVLSCRGIDCNDCLFDNMDNFSEWVRQAKTRGEE